MIVIALGTRAELIKTAPVMKELDRRGINYYYVHTGQHDVRDLIKTLKVLPPDLSLETPATLRGRFSNALEATYWNMRTFWRLRRVFTDKEKVGKVKLVLVHGDTMTTTSATLAAKTILPNPPLVGHIEAGLRSGNLAEPWPEELSRRITDKFSDLLFAPTNRTVINLNRERAKGKIILTGNTNIDVLKENLPATKNSCLILPKKPFVFAQIHRQENIKNKKRLEAFVQVLENIPRPTIFVFLENTKAMAKKYGLEKRINNLGNVMKVDNLPYHEFLNVASNASCILTDGGGQTEEAAFLQIPCVIFRKYNERKEAEEENCAIRVGSNPKKAIKYVKEAVEQGEFYQKVKASKNPFGSGNAAKKIVDEIQKHI